MSFGVVHNTYSNNKGNTVEVRGVVISWQAIKNFAVIGLNPQKDYNKALVK